MQEVKVSVIVPVYNTEKFLKKCIESIVNQTLKEIEIILINDGSTDNSSVICEEYSKKFPQKIRYINNKNIGCSATRNLGINLAKGEYIAFVDSDDYIEKEMYQEMYYKAKNENLDIVISGIKSTFLDSNRIIYLYPKNIFRKYDYLKNKNNMSYCTGKLFKKEQIIKNNISFPLDTHHGEDLYFSFINLIISKNIGHIEKCYYNYIYHGNNSVYNLDKRLEIFVTFDKLYKYLFEKKYLGNKLIQELFYKGFNEAVIKNTFLMLSNTKLISEEEYKKYSNLFYNRLKKVRFLSLESKILIYFYRYASLVIRKLDIYEELKKIKEILKK